MNRRTLITLSACALALAVTLIPTITKAQEDVVQPASAALKVFDHYVGHWNGKRASEFIDAAGQVTEIAATEQLTGRWILGGRVMELSVVFDTGDRVMRYMVLLTHDENASQYRGWALTEAGEAITVTGKWNADKKLMQWTSDDGLRKIDLTYANRNKMSVKQVIKNEAGDVIYRQKGKSKRADAAPNVKSLDADGPAAGPMEKIAGAAGQWEFESQSQSDNNNGNPIFSGTTTGRFILGGHYLRHDRLIKFGDQQMTMVEFTWYDAKSNKYRRLSMAPRGRFNEGTGEFDDETKIMTWQASSGAEMKWTTKTQYGQADKMTSTTAGKSPDGSRSFNMTTVSNRVKAKP